MPKVIKRGAAAPPKPRPANVGKRARKPIIEREVVGATKEARRIVQEAEQEAQQIVEAANEAARETHQRGFEEGREEALATFTKKYTESLRRFQTLEAELEPAYVGLVTECVQKIMDAELTLNPDSIVGVVRNALRDARQQREIIVRVHPVDAEALNKNKNRLLEMLARAQSVEVREDKSVRRGGCVVVTELGTIDASLDRQIGALSAALDAELQEANADYREESELDPEDDPGYGGDY